MLPDRKVKAPPGKKKKMLQKALCWVKLSRWVLAKVLETSGYIKGDGRFLLEIRQRMAILIFP